MHKQSVQEIIGDAKKRGFTVTFVGTEFDTQKAVKDFGVDKSNTMTHDNTEFGVQYSFAQTRNATKMYTEKVIKGEDVSMGFYKSNEKL